jgi:hypothetical protein
MRFYDCDDEEQLAALKSRIEEEGLLARNLLQGFAPDTPIEAMNRSYRPVPVPHPG